jgi:GAF domain-containing protein
MTIAAGDSRESALADLFVALADTLVDDFDVVELLDRLVSSCVDLFGVASAGVLLLDGTRRLRLVASSSERAEALEAFQIQADEGPCLDCARSMRPVSIPDLEAARERWPRFCAAADVLGFRAVHALPLRLRTVGLGGFGLFHTEPTVMQPHDLHTAQALADVATIGILQQEHVHRSATVAEQLQGALDSRVAVEQAKGILAESGNVGMDVAFAHLRRYARDRNLKLSQLAQSIARREIGATTIIQAAGTTAE